MNAFVAESYVEHVHRLALGLEPLEALRQGRLTHPVRVDVEGVPWLAREARAPFRHILRPGDPRPGVSRHDSCLHALLYHPALADSIDLRIYDHARRYVPRRLRVPLLTLAEAETRPQVHRVRRPVLFPGAAYDATSRATGLRGRVLRDDEPMRWVRVEAHLPDTNTLVARAHGDDRGEFLLLLSSAAAPFGELTDPFDVRVTVSGPALAPTPATPSLPEQDEFWDLPLEELPPPGDPDPVAAGETFPDGYVASLSATRVVAFRLGRTISGVDDFVFS